MSKIDVVWKIYKTELDDADHSKLINRGYWDQAMLEDIFSGEMWSPIGNYEFEHHNDFDKVKEGAVVVLPARHQVENFHQLNADIAKLKWVVLVLSGDEEGVFPFDLIIHPNIRYWVMSPKKDKHGEPPITIQPLGAGYPPHARQLLKKYKSEYLDKKLDWFFAGQNNNVRRSAAVDQLVKLKGKEEIKGELVESAGFTQGLKPEEYFKLMASAKITVCPGGNYTPETFRLFESLEAGCYPFADNRAAIYPHEYEYWDWFFKEPVPFPAYVNPLGLYDYIIDVLPDWENKAIKVYAWWQQKKRELTYKMMSDIYEVSHIEPESGGFKDDVTIFIPTSPIPKHPSTEMISETVRLMRLWFPQSEIIIMIDGIRPEQYEQYKEKYPRYVRELLWKCNFEWKNVLPLVFTEHMHQVAMTREALKMAKTPFGIFVEHDCPLTPDNFIDMAGIIKVLKTGEFNVIRFHHEAMILDGNKQFMLDDQPKMYEGVPIVRTFEWSQRPHLFSIPFYKRISDQYFTPGARTMYEDVLHGRITNECADKNLMAWYNWRVGIYHPEGHIKRSSNFDGREGDEKYAEKYIF